MMAVYQMLLSFCVAATPATKTQKFLDQSTAIFRGGNSVTQLEVEKTTVFELLDKTTKSKGDIFLGKGKFRWNVLSPEKSQIVYDGKILWTAQEDLGGGKTQVTKSRVDGKAKDQILVKLLAGDGKFSSKFKIEQVETKGELKVFHLKALKEDPAIKTFSLSVDKSGKKLRAISYVDEVGNRTEIEILNHKTIKKPDAKLFKFEIPKNSEVNEL